MHTIESSVQPGDQMTAPSRVVLHPSHKSGEYVTHIQNMQDNGYNWGHYFDDFDDALIDYVARCKKHGVISRVIEMVPGGAS